jgi:hypothetical protein
MSDSGEGLVDAEARLQEQIDAREQERQRRNAGPPKDPRKTRTIESLRLAKEDLTRQLTLTSVGHRKVQIQAAISEIDRRMAEV